MNHKKELKNSIKFLFVAVFALLLFGTILFHSIEGWSYLDSFYFVSMTATTVGYGDFTPTHALSKILTVIYSMTIVPVVLYSFTAIAKYELEKINSKMHGIEKKQIDQESEIEKTERKIAESKKILKEQQELIEKQEREIKRQERINREQKEELEGHQKKIKLAQKEIKNQEEELEVVEDIVGDNIKKL